MHAVISTRNKLHWKDNMTISCKIKQHLTTLSREEIRQAQDTVEQLKNRNKRKVAIFSSETKRGKHILAVKLVEDKSTGLL